ncbi:MAG: DUF3857 domain-containing protein [Acidobacteriota bacterium]
MIIKGNIRTASLRVIALFLCLTMTGLWRSSSTATAEDAPPWLRQAAVASAPILSKYVPAIALLREQNIRVEEDGRVTTIERGAVKILTNEGRDEAEASMHYLTDTAKVRNFQAWIIRPSGEVKKFGKDEVLDLAIPNDVYNEVRIRAVSAAREADNQTIFGYEWTMEDRSVFTQFDWQFQDRLPTLLSRFTLTLPQGWRAEGVTFNRPRVEPVVNGSSYTWELRELPFIEDEPSAPAVTNIAPRLAVSYFSAPGKSAPGATFDSWASVSRWLTSLNDSQAALDDALASKARQLTTASKTELERIQAIGRFAQSINYVSIQTGVGRGGGYRPHAATEVFAKAYGDCKDKANLMRAMLRALGVTSYLVSIYSGDPAYVREEWPSPQQFNHCIIAIKVSDETQAATIVKHPSLGRLLIFDPTDDMTPVGDLPDHEQGSLALIIAGDQGALMRMPMTPAEMNRLDRQVEGTLNADGSIAVKLRENSSGQSAVEERRAFRGLAKPDYVKVVERWITRGVTGASITRVEPVDKMDEGRFALDVEFTASRYGQLMQGRLLVFKPALVSRHESVFLTERARRHDVVLEPYSYVEQVKVKLPDGFAVDETPDAVKVESAFGAYSTAYEVKDGQLHFRRSLIVRGGTIPANQFAMVRGFFEKMRAAEQAPVVLMKK